MAERLTMPDDLRTALRRLNDAAYEALKEAKKYDRSSALAKDLRSIAVVTGFMVDETAPNVTVLPAPTVPSEVGEMMERCRRDVEELTGIAPNVEGKP